MGITPPRSQYKVRPFGDFDACYGDGNSTENHIRKKRVPNGIGGGQECWAAEPITGEGYHCVSVQKILKEKVLMDLGDDWPIGYEDVKPYYDQGR